MVVKADRSAKYGGADAAKYLSKQLPKLFWLFPIAHSAIDAFMALDLSPTPSAATASVAETVILERVEFHSRKQLHGAFRFEFTVTIEAGNRR